MDSDLSSWDSCVFNNYHFPTVIISLLSLSHLGRVSLSSRMALLNHDPYPHLLITASNSQMGWVFLKEKFTIAA